jgi:hypothetical protein
MTRNIRSAGITLVALITFVVIGARIVWDFQTWECKCTNVECGECFVEPIQVPGCTAECTCDECCWLQAATEFADEFTALFNSYECKWSKNGRLMIRQGDSGSFKFVKRSA